MKIKETKVRIIKKKIGFNKKKTEKGEDNKITIKKKLLKKNKWRENKKKQENSKI